MKLHLPVALLRAVMALFATTTTFTSAWAESTVVEPLVITLSEDAVYEQWDNTLFEKSVEIEEMNWVNADVILTSGADNKNSVSATFTNSTYPAFFAPYVTLQNLEALSFNNLDSTAIYGHQGISILNNNSVSFINIEYVQDTGTSIGGAMDNGDMGDGVVLVQDNGRVSFVGNSAKVTEGGSAEGAVVRADNVYLRNNGSVSVTENESYTKDGDCIGGAISAGGGSFDLSYTNGNIDISGNSAVSGSNHRVLGGAILAIDMIQGYDGRISINNNSGEAITIKNNTAKTGAAARTEYGNNDTPIYVVAGGALLGMKQVELANNTSSLIEISNNKAIAEGSNDVYGGAIATFGNISIVNNKPSAAAVAEGEIARQGIVFDSNEASSVSGAVYGGAIVSSNDKFAELDPSGNADEVLPNEVKFADNGDIAFTNNRAVSGVVNTETSELSGGAGAYGGAIYSNGDVTLGYVDENGEIHGNGNVEFIGNSAGSGDGHASGGAIFANGDVTVSGNTGVVKFNENKAHATGASAEGGAIYAADVVTLSGNGYVEFEDNKLVSEGWEAQGAAIYSEGTVALKENAKVAFVGNSAESCYVDGYNPSRYHSDAAGGAIYSSYWTDDEESGIGVSIVENGEVEFSNNTVVAGRVASGGAIHNENSAMQLSGNDSITFSQNKAEAKRDGGVKGGAIYSREKLTLTGNGNILFDGNTISTVGGYAQGSAIAVGNDINDSNGGVFIDGNTGTITVSNNGVTTYGKYYGKDGNQYISGALAAGAIVSTSTISISGNVGKITFSGNYINDIAGTEDKPFDFNGSSSSSSSALIAGAAIASAGAVVVNENKSDILFTGNILTSQCKSVFGGAMVNVMGDITFSKNEGKIEFTNNSASTTAIGYAWGGAVSTCATLAGTIVPGITVQSSVVFDGNGDISFSGNKVSAQMGLAAGGAIYSSNDVKLTNNGDVLFGGALQGEGNTAQGYEANGGAIYSGGNVAIGGVNESGESQGNGDVTFAGNSAIGEGASAKGGAISSPRGGVSISGNGAVTFSGNSAIAQTYADGGAIHVDDTDGKAASVEISNNTGAVTFENNQAIASISSSRGGAICNYATEVIISGNTYGVGAALPAGEEDIQYSLAFTGNIAGSLQNSQAVGGAIYSIGSTEITGNGNILFGDNIVFSAGGDVFGAAIGTDQGGLFIDDNLGGLTVEGNQVYAVGTIYNSDGSYYGQGARLVSGAVTSMTTLSISRNAGDIVFSGNSIQEKSVTLEEGQTLAGSGSDSNTISITAGAAVGAMSDIYLDENQGNISFIGNTVTSSCKDVLGGAIASATGDIRISNNNKDKAVVFSGNSVTSTKSSAKGGAIGTYAYDPNSGSSASVVITNNGSITFSDNSVVAGVRDQDGNIVSYHNIAHGGAIYSEGDVELSYNGDILFSGNTAAGNGANGGAVYSKGDVTLSNNSSVSFYDNALEPTDGDAFGGAIYSEKSVSIENNTNGVNFSRNSITCNVDDDGFGGAIYAGVTSGSSYANADFGHNVKLSGNGNVTFADNKIVSEFRARGGAIYADGYITLSGNGDVTFSGNSVKSDDGGSAIGGAIATYLIMGDDGKDPNNYATIPVGVTLSGNGAITFSGNSSTAGRATANGGAIYSAGKVEMTGNSGNILFSGNSNEALSAYSSAGGAIAGFNGVVISGNTGESIRFENNLNKSNGGNSGAGAVYASYNNVSIIDNKGVAIEFNGNRVEGVGRFNVLETDDSITTVDAAVVGGGAIGTDSSSVIIKNNGAVSFTDNVVVDNDAAPETTIDRNAVDVEAIAPGLNVTGGGAIMSMANTEISGNAGVTISGNSATSDSRTAMGGAIAAVGSASISHNKGDVNVSGNYAASKTGTAKGGAIFAQNGLSIVNNEGNVTFSGNYVQNGDTHTLNSVVVAGGNVELAAVEGKSISFYDSVLVGSGSEMVLNSYSGQTTTGAIVFSGANAVETLQQLKGEGGTVTSDEISASLTSQINRDVTVAGGSLQVKDGAVLQMQSLVVNDGAELLIGAGSTVGGVDVGGVDIDITVTFDAGSEYTVQGLKAATTLKPGEVASSTPTAQIAGNIVLTAGMTYTMDGAYTELVGSANTLAFEGSGTYTFNVDESVAYTEGTTKYFVLFTGVDTLAGVDPSDLTGIEFLTNIGYYDDIMLHYLNHEKAGGVLYISATIPEPTTATLSLLALAALAARRRRK